jgi:hypothetical protein
LKSLDRMDKERKKNNFLRDLDVGWAKMKSKESLIVFLFLGSSVWHQEFGPDLVTQKPKIRPQDQDNFPVSRCY